VIASLGEFRGPSPDATLARGDAVREKRAVPSVAELSEPYGDFMLGPRAGPDVCELCFDFTRGTRRCHSCSRTEDALAAVAPISYSVGGEQLHQALLGYK
jgi:hypothetical protein